MDFLCRRGMTAREVERMAIVLQEDRLKVRQRVLFSEQAPVSSRILCRSVVKRMDSPCSVSSAGLHDRLSDKTVHFISFKMKQLLIPCTEIAVALIVWVDYDLLYYYFGVDHYQL